MDDSLLGQNSLGQLSQRTAIPIPSGNGGWVVEADNIVKLETQADNGPLL